MIECIGIDTGVFYRVFPEFIVVEHKVCFKLCKYKVKTGANEIFVTGWHYLPRNSSYDTSFGLMVHLLRYSIMSFCP